MIKLYNSFYILTIYFFKYMYSKQKINQIYKLDFGFFLITAKMIKWFNLSNTTTKNIYTLIL